MSEVNPYKPPSSHVADVAPAAADEGSFIEGGRAVGAGRGWAWIAEAFQMFRSSPGTWIVIIIVLAVILIVVGLVPLLGSLANIALLPVFTGGIMIGCHGLRQGGTLEIGHVFAGFREHAGKLVIIGLLSIAAWIVVAIPTIAMIGGGTFFALLRGDPASAELMGRGVALALLVMLALSIPVYMALWFAPALVTLRNLAPTDALKQSFRACLKNIIPFLLYGVVMLVLSMIAVIPLGLGLLVVGPMLMASVYVAYRDIFFGN
ncbi:MAG: hypothetical protein HYU76_02330 [Betaproteobacteria bacterium]|nr:hypothetical protein [Betaproteobacteria bacterium]